MLRQLLLLSCCPAILAAQGASMDASSGEPRIVASATRSTRLIADRGVLLLTVEASGENSADASQRATVRLQAVTAALRSAGIAADAINVIPFTISPAMGRDPFNQPSGAQMVARHVIRVPVSRLDQLMSLSAAALSAGATQAFPQMTESAATDSVRRARNAEALAAAQSDAQGLATALGGRLGTLIEVTASPQGAFNPNQNFPLFVNQFQNYSGSMGLPEIPVTATVSVRYRFIPR
ncbi:MAG TPA: SIMPL domain-containing protein [Gemmatimonadaceae bacterium]|nr:SIMPL domain-containing protein [Gemmatimonadaceae bacterium]